MVSKYTNIGYKKKPEDDSFTKSTLTCSLKKYKVPIYITDFYKRNQLIYIKTKKSTLILIPPWEVFASYWNCPLPLSTGAQTCSMHLVYFEKSTFENRNSVQDYCE